RPSVLPRGYQRPASIGTVESQGSHCLPHRLRSVPMPNSCPVRRLQCVPRLGLMNESGAASQILDGRPELEQKPPTSSTPEKEHDMAHTTVIYEGAGGTVCEPRSSRWSALPTMVSSMRCMTHLTKVRSESNS